MRPSMKCTQHRPRERGTPVPGSRSSANCWQSVGCGPAKRSSSIIVNFQRALSLRQTPQVPVILKGQSRMQKQSVCLVNSLPLSRQVTAFFGPVGDHEVILS